MGHCSWEASRPGRRCPRSAACPPPALVLAGAVHQKPVHTIEHAVAESTFSVRAGTITMRLMYSWRSCKTVGAA